MAAQRRGVSLKPPVVFPQGVKNILPRPLNKILVKFRPGVDPADFVRRFNPPGQAALNARANLGANAPVLKSLRAISHLDWHVFQLQDASLLNSTLAALNKHPDVVRAEPDYHIPLPSIASPCSPPLPAVCRWSGSSTPASI
jgi:hypothetical protein